jgi:hypothetical protein
MTVIVEIDASSKSGKAFIDYVKSLSFAKVIDKTHDNQLSKVALKKSKRQTYAADGLMSDLREAVEEVRLHKQGKIKLKTAQELLNEL